jgi:signal transduction histidine kinase
MRSAAALAAKVSHPLPSAKKGMRPPGALILAGFFVAVIAFVAATLVSDARFRQVSIQSADIDANVFPRVVAIATLRERMREVMTNLSTAIDTGDAVLPLFDARLTQIDEQRAAFDAHASAEEREQWNAVQPHIARALGGAGRVRELLRTTEIAAARALVDNDVRPAAAAADKELWRLEEASASEGARSARHIEIVRRSATALSFALDALCVGIAATLAIITLRGVRRYARLVETRSDELEQFASRVAHDLRSPLSPVLLALQCASKDTSVDDPRRTMIDRAIRSVGRVTTLVDDLLAFARAGGEVDRAARASALEGARAAVDDARAQAESASIDLRLDPRSIDIAVACPPGVLTSLVSNLVRNAIKYMGSARERRVVVRVAPGSAKAAHLEVIDTGPGLPEGAAERVFEPYVRADRSGQPGLGLGLATVKRLTEAYGGRVGVRSSASGCTFWFELPSAAVGPS